MRTLFIALLWSASLAAQTPGPASFRIVERGTQVGTADVTLERTADGWRLHGRSRADGAVPLSIVNLDLHYSKDWSGRFMTMEMKAPDDVILHVAIAGTVTRTDIVRATEARFRTNSVSPDTIFLPDRAYAAYEAVAARLAAGPADLPVYIPPLGETRAIIEDVRTERVETTGGPITATHYTMTEVRDRPTTVEIWVHSGRLVRVDVARSEVSVIRSDVRP